MEFPSWIQRFHPLVPLDELVGEINRIYHSFDSKNYDREHLEIDVLWPELWASMVQQLPDRSRWRVLDFGCGTGFEAGQILQHLGPGIDILAGYDPSPEMLAKAKDRFRGNNKVFFTDDLPSLQHGAPYNLLITNSVLHHLVDFAGAVSGLEPFLAGDAYWLSGNEPSARFYKNTECVQLFKEYAAHYERMKWFRPSAYIGKFKSMLGANSLALTAREAVKRGLFAMLPSEPAVAGLVDFHVHQVEDDLRAERGFDLAALEATFKPNWRLQWSKTYSYLGAFGELRAPRQWREKAQSLQQKHPTDGANFCAVWRRNG